MNSDIRFYISVFFRRIHYFILIAVVVTAAGVTTAIILPTKYEAEAVLLVESAQIPDELAASTVQTNPQEQLEILRQRLLTRPILLEIANENNVFPDRAKMFPDEVIAAMRENTTFNISTGRDRASLVTIRFLAERPQTTAAVVNAYITQVLENNVELRTDRAEGTMDFFEQELTRLSADLSRKSAEILEFKNANIDSLPENLQYQLQRLDDLRDRSNDIRTEILALAQQRERLILVFNATGGGTQPGQDLRSPQQRELDAAEEQLASLLLTFSDQNPRVRALRARIEALKTAVENAAPADSGGAPSPTSILDIQLSEIDSRTRQLEQEQTEVAAEIEALQANLQRVPGNTIALDSLNRDYENIQEQYNQAVARASAAATGERIELLSKGERISVISQPVVPREPSSPNRVLISIGGALAGIGFGLAAVLGIELLNRSIRRPVDITRALGITPLATLPMMRTPREIALRRGLILGLMLAGTAGIAAAVFYLHTEVMPIDLLATRAIDRIGL